MAKSRSGMWPWVGIIVATLVFIVVARWWRSRTPDTHTPDTPVVDAERPTKRTPAPVTPQPATAAGTAPTPARPATPTPPATAGSARGARYAVCELNDVPLQEPSLTLVRVPERATPLLVVACRERYEVLDFEPPERDGALVMSRLATLTWSQLRPDTKIYARTAVVRRGTDRRAHIVLAFARNSLRGGTRGGQLIDVPIDALGAWSAPRVLHEVHTAAFAAGRVDSRAGDELVVVDGGEPSGMVAVVSRRPTRS